MTDDARGLQIQVDTMAAIAATRETQFTKCRMERDAMAMALRSAIAALRSSAGPEEKMNAIASGKDTLQAAGYVI